MSGNQHTETDMVRLSSAYGGINVFAELDVDLRIDYPVLDTIRSYVSDSESTQSRAPPSDNGEVKYSLEGINKDGIEVYETSEEVKALTRKERQKKFLEIMQNEYRGRTAKFVRNGHTYYAKFDSEDVNKNIYGDKRSSNSGYNAKIKVGADGNIFELVENAKYNGSEKEIGKSAKAHKQIQYWDYYIKTVQIDNQVYDLVANVRRKSTGDFVYSIQLRANNTIEASAAQQPNQKVGVNKAANASENSISPSAENFNTKFSAEPSENVKLAEKHFGTTYKIAEAGYILTDGKMLDFSGKHEGARGGYRTVDHRDIIDALGEEYGNGDYSSGMVRFMSEGNIRVSPESGGINLSVAPNKAQRSTLDRYISNFRGEVILDIDDVNGSTVASVEYPKYIHSSVVLNDIDAYFDKGRVPEKFSQEPMTLKQLEAENKKLKKQLEYWRNQTKKNPKKTVRESDVKAFAKAIVESCDTDIKPHEIVPDLMELGNYKHWREYPNPFLSGYNRRRLRFAQSQGDSLPQSQSLACNVSLSLKNLRPLQLRFCS